MLSDWYTLIFKHYTDYFIFNAEKYYGEICHTSESRVIYASMQSY